MNLGCNLSRLLKIKYISNWVYGLLSNNLKLIVVIWILMVINNC